MSQTVVATPIVQAGPARVRRPPGPVSKLKSERVQEELAAMGWRPDPGVRTFDRALKFPASRVAGAYAAFVSELADQCGQPCTVTLRGKQVTVTLLGQGGKDGWTKAALNFAKRLVA